MYHSAYPHISAGFFPPGHAVPQPVLGPNGTYSYGVPPGGPFPGSAAPVPIPPNGLFPGAAYNQGPPGAGAFGQPPQLPQAPPAGPFGQPTQLTQGPPPGAAQGTQAAQGFGGPQSGPAAGSTGQSKAQLGSTLMRNPDLFPYYLNHIGETPPDRAFREAAEGKERALMIGSPDEAQLLRTILEFGGARKVVEVGVFRGTTTLQLARAVGPQGLVYAFDVSRAWLDGEGGGFDTWRRAGVAERIVFVEGPATASMARLAQTESGTVDLVFIDADKVSYDAYYELALRLLRPGGLIAVDNVLWGGRVLWPQQGDEDTAAIVALNAKIRADPRVRAVMVGVADGVYLATKL